MLCPHLSECGGCPRQAIPYPDQIQLKQAEIEALFSHPVLPIIPCVDPWQYRNKMEFSFSQNKAGDRFCGLIIRSSRGKVFNLETCQIASSWFSETLGRVRAWWASTNLQAYHFHKGTGSLRTLTLRKGIRTGEKMAFLTVSGDPAYGLHKTHLKGFQEAVGDASAFIRIQQCIKGSPTQFYELHLQGPTHIHEEITVQGRTFRFAISPTSFFQPNTVQAQEIYSEALRLANLKPSDHLLDLYAGTATIGLIFAPHVRKVTAIENNPHAVFDAKHNAELNHIDNLTPLCGDAGALLASLESVDIAIVDPPRTGLDPQALAHLERLRPRTIVYISCNPKTQAQNLAGLPSYRIEAIQPVDQFPHTAHVENIVVLGVVKQCPHWAASQFHIPS